MYRLLVHGILYKISAYFLLLESNSILIWSVPRLACHLTIIVFLSGLMLIVSEPSCSTPLVACNSSEVSLSYLG